jgi:4-hydroxybenzoate polyprenyltransferase
VSRFFVLSRTPHGVLDLAAPAFCALLWLGAFPPWQTILLALITAFAGYTAVYALNDFMGMKTDREKFAGSGINPGFAVEASPDRHPLAQRLLSVRSCLFWMGGWFVVAVIGSYVLNPTIILILGAAAGLEIVYCLLLKVTHLRTIIGGIVKTCGPMAAVFVLDPHPSAPLLLLLFAWLFLWEIGGQNIPSDWNDTVEDTRVNAKTVPIRLGFELAGRLILGALVLAVIASGFLPLVSPARLGLPYVAATLLVGYFLLLRPALRLYRLKEGRLAARLFDSASYYPLAQLSLITAFLAAGSLGA